MGKPYNNDLAQLNETYDWAQRVNISLFKRAVLISGSYPLVAIGSGGSLTAAHFMASAHRRFARRVATVSTPLDAISEEMDHHMSTWLFSAGGTNVDILASFSTIVGREHAQICVMCGRPGSPLVDKAKQHQYVDTFDFSMPSGKDGFLATNSLLAFCVFIARAYNEGFGNTDSVPKAINVGLDRVILLEWKDILNDLWERETTIVLHSAASRIGAIDLESKFTEAALGNLQIADYRNFAHGRHNWLAKRGKTSGIIAFITPEDKELAKKTLALIPKEIPVAPIYLTGDHLDASLTSLVAAFHIAGWAGIARGIDPGRPGIPVFGRRLYNLALPRKKKSHNKLSKDDSAAIERKAGMPASRLNTYGALEFWRKSLLAFRKKIAGTKFLAVVFDYDGTLVDNRNRFDPPCPAVLQELERLLDSGLIIGIATGRGVSVQRDMQSCLPRSLWDRVIIGYYNGADISFLSDNAHPDGTPKPGPELKQLANALRCCPELKEIARQEDRRRQITLEPLKAIPEGRLWDITNQIIQTVGVEGIGVVRSSHSVDILASGVSKLLVVKHVLDIYNPADDVAILTIGDRGRWPGNDFELLREPYSLSVDELSVDPETCWNLAPVGQRGVQVTIGYCRALRKVSGGGARFFFQNARSKI